MNTAPDVVLVQPPLSGLYNFWKSESLGLGYLAASLEAKGYSVHVIDAFLEECSVQDTVHRILARPPRLLLGFSLLSYDLYRSAQAVLSGVRDAGLNAHVSCGSWFPTFWHKTIIDEGTPIDSVVVGEGERSLCALVDYLRDGHWGCEEATMQRSQYRDVMVLRQKHTLEDLDSLPPPRRDYLSATFQRYHLGTVYTSRGCGHNRCTFCSVPHFYRGGPRHRLRSAANVVEEVSQLARTGIDFFFFVDEDFLGQPPEGPRRALEIFERAAELDVQARYTFNCTALGVDERLFRRLRDLGLAAVYIGVESNLDRVLTTFLKGIQRQGLDRALGILRELDIKLVPGWIMFERDTTLEEVEQQIRFLLQLDAYHVNYLKALYVMKDTAMERAYAGDLYQTYFHTKYFCRDPDVDLLVRILTNDYLPEVMPFTNSIYPIWHKLLAGYGSPDQQRRYDRINARMRELSLGFTSDVIQRIRQRSLTGVARELAAQVQAWREVGQDIEWLSQELAGPARSRLAADPTGAAEVDRASLGVPSEVQRLR